MLFTLICIRCLWLLVGYTKEIDQFPNNSLKFLVVSVDPVSNKRTEDQPKVLDISYAYIMFSFFNYFYVNKHIIFFSLLG